MIVSVTPIPSLDRNTDGREVVLNEMTRAARIREDWGARAQSLAGAHGDGAQSWRWARGGAPGKRAARLHGWGIATVLIPVAARRARYRHHHPRRTSI